MKRMVLAFTLLVLGIPGSIGIANAGMPKATLGFVLRNLRSVQGTPAPTEWDGIWATVDSTYFPCENPFGIRSTGADTICAGQSFGEPSEPGFTVTCSGNADATTFHLHCTGTGDLGGGCSGSVDLTIDGTRTNDTYTTVAVTNFTPSTPSGECFAVCIRSVTHGTRTGPAPADFCRTTEVERSSWSRIKILYR